MTHRASSESWGDESGARICQLVMQDNNGIAQSIADNRIDLLELLTFEELNQADDLGLKPIYLAIQYDQPEVLLYLYNRGVNINNFCKNGDAPPFYEPEGGELSMARLVGS